MIFVLYERFQPVVRHSPVQFVTNLGAFFSNAGRALLGETVAFLGCFCHQALIPCTLEKTYHSIYMISYQW